MTFRLHNRVPVYKMQLCSRVKRKNMVFQGTEVADFQDFGSKGDWAGRGNGVAGGSAQVAPVMHACKYALLFLSCKNAAKFIFRFRVLSEFETNSAGDLIRICFMPHFGCIFLNSLKPNYVLFLRFLTVKGGCL